MLTIRAQFYYLRLFLDIENVSSRPLARVPGGGGGGGEHKLKIGKGGQYCLEKKVEKMANFWPKPWTNPFGKISIFRLFERFVFIA